MKGLFDVMPEHIRVAVDLPENIISPIDFDNVTHAIVGICHQNIQCVFSGIRIR